jgi:hypothetical protein
MKKASKAFRLLLASTALISGPAFAQVSGNLLGTTTSTGVLGAGLGALRNGGIAITSYKDNDPTKEATSQTTGTASGGKVGTFTFSANEGTSQNFSVGTSTNLGVNASASSTQEYSVDSRASLGIGTSTFRQTIGTSGISQQADVSNSAKSSYVSDAVQSKVGTTETEYYSKALSDSKSLSSTDMQQKYSWWSPTYSTSTDSESLKTASTTNSSESFQSRLDKTTSHVTTQAESEFSRSTSSRDAANGVISGTFRAASTSTGTTPATNSTDNNEVTVKGIGNAASLNAGGSSEFRTVVTARGGTPASNSATANGSAGANMGSSSTANASNTSFSSVFIQSF